MRACRRERRKKVLKEGEGKKEVFVFPDLFFKERFHFQILCGDCNFSQELLFIMNLKWKKILRMCKEKTIERQGAASLICSNLSGCWAALMKE